MISEDELQYVDKFARMSPYPGDDYAIKTIDKLIDAITFFQKKYQDKEFKLILSNGEEIDFAIKSKNLCHLLGIDYKTFISDYMQSVREKVFDMVFYDQITSYDLLYEIIDRADEVIKNDRYKYNKHKILNYYKVFVKCSMFMKLSDFETFNFGFINFDKEIFRDSTGKDLHLKTNKIICAPNDQTLIPYYILGMFQDIQTNIFVPETLYVTKDFVDFFINQELLVPIQLLINNNKNNNFKNIIATPKEKLNILKMYRYIIQEFQTYSYVNIYNDYENTLEELSLK